jgi:small subunit ribosomal protein S6e
LRKTDDVRKYVVRREIKKGDKTFYKSPKIQRLITEKRIRRKTLMKKVKLDRFKKTKEDRAKYDKVLSKYIKEKKAQVTAAAEPKAPVAAPAKAAPKKEEVKQVKKEVAKDVQAKRPANKEQKQGKK